MECYIDLETSDGPATFEVIPMDGIRQCKLITYFASNVGPTVQEALFSNNWTALLSKLDEKTFDYLLKETLHHVNVKYSNRSEMNAQAKFAKIFQGKPMQLFKLLGFAIQLNLGEELVNFIVQYLQPWMEAAKELQKSLLTPTPTQATSPGAAQD